MTVNSFNKKIKEMKLELTNLKTAHRRGLGLVRVYRARHYYVNDNIEPPGIYVGTLTIEYPDDSPPYPFAYFVSPNPGNLMSYDYTKGIDVLSVRFENNGHRAIYQCRIFFGSNDLYECSYLFTTVPTSRMYGVWEEE